MSKQTRAAICMGLVILSASGCRSSSAEKSGGNPPGIPIVTAPSIDLTADECKSKVYELFNHPDLAKITTIPSSLRNTSFLVALSISSGRMDAKCLDFAYAQGQDSAN